MQPLPTLETFTVKLPQNLIATIKICAAITQETLQEIMARLIEQESRHRTPEIKALLSPCEVPDVGGVR